MNTARPFLLLLISFLLFGGTQSSRAHGVFLLEDVFGPPAERSEGDQFTDPIGPISKEAWQILELHIKEAETDPLARHYLSSLGSGAVGYLRQPSRDPSAYAAVYDMGYFSELGEAEAIALCRHWIRTSNAASSINTEWGRLAIEHAEELLPDAIQCLGWSKVSREFVCYLRAIPEAEILENLGAWKGAPLWLYESRAIADAIVRSSPPNKEISPDSPVLLWAYKVEPQDDWRAFVEANSHRGIEAIRAEALRDLRIRIEAIGATLKDAHEWRGPTPDQMEGVAAAIEHLRLHDCRDPKELSILKRAIELRPKVGFPSLLDVPQTEAPIFRYYRSFYAQQEDSGRFDRMAVIENLEAGLDHRLQGIRKNRRHGYRDLSSAIFQFHQRVVQYRKEEGERQKRQVSRRSEGSRPADHLDDIIDLYYNPEHRERFMGVLKYYRSHPDSAGIVADHFRELVERTPKPPIAPDYWSQYQRRKAELEQMGCIKVLGAIGSREARNALQEILRLTDEDGRFAKERSSQASQNIEWIERRLQREDER